LKVFFYCERSTGRGLRGKRARKFERQGLKRSRVVEPTRKPHEADLIFARNIPERTNDQLLERMSKLLDGFAGTRVLNHPRSMLLSDSRPQL
jgi:hypothetical protein